MPQSRKFDPDAYVLVTQMEERASLAVYGEPDEFVQGYVAKLYQMPSDGPDELDPDKAAVVAKVEFQVIGLNAYVNGGFGTPYAMLDDLSQDLSEVGDALFGRHDLDDPGTEDDGRDMPKEELGFALPGGDLLYLEQIELSKELGPEAVFEFVRYLLENLIVRFGRGCFTAVYYHANWESIGLARPLKDRGFKQMPGKRNIWFADLGLKRDELPLDPS